MMMKTAMQGYFERLTRLYQESFGTWPTVSWDPEMDQTLFVSEPDEDGEAQWKAVPGQPLNYLENQTLPSELAMLFGGWYYWQLRGSYRDMDLDFPSICNRQMAKKVAKTAIADGNHYFPGKNYALLATCSKDGNDDLLLFYCQDTGGLFVYDRDKRSAKKMVCSLTQLIRQMEATL